MHSCECGMQVEEVAAHLYEIGYSVDAFINMSSGESGKSKVR
jgi:hypothetical protein